MKKFRPLLLICLLLSVQSMFAENMDEIISKLAGAAGEKYVEPIVSPFGANLNTGWVHSLPDAEILGFDFEFSTVASAAFLSGGDKKFNVSTKLQLTSEQAALLAHQDPGWNGYSPEDQAEILHQLVISEVSVSIFGPTIIGKNTDSICVQYTGSNPNISLPDGSHVYGMQFTLLDSAGLLNEAPAIPFVIPQVNLGTLFGTQLAIRYFPTVALNDDIGKVGFFGFGLTHNPAVWFGDPELLPLDLSAGFYYQKLKIGDLFEASATQFGVYGSKTFGFSFLNVTPYAGLTYEKFTSTIKYDYKFKNDLTGETYTEKIKLDLEGDNTVRFTLGSSFKLGIVNLNLDYNLAKYSTASAGLGFVF